MLTMDSRGERVSMRRLLAMMVLVLSVAACSRPVAGPQSAPQSHTVLYTVFADGTANDDVQIQYSGADGQQSASTPGFAPTWTTTVVVVSDTATLDLSAFGVSSDQNFQLNCFISVDQIPAATGRGPSSCMAEFDLADLPAARAAHPPITPSATHLPATGAPAALPAGCHYLDSSAVSDAVADASGVIKPVQREFGDATSCTYVIDENRTQVRIEWRTGGRVDAQTRAFESVPGLGSPAYLLDLGPIATLYVQRGTGLCTIRLDVSPLFTQLDHRKFLVAVYRAAKLP